MTGSDSAGAEPSVRSKVSRVAAGWLKRFGGPPGAEDHPDGPDGPDWRALMR